MKSDFFKLYLRPELKGLPKYVELRETLRNAIKDGYWKKGEKLPSEAEIAKITPLSLGTVQKALGALVAEGVVERRQGHGTFVANDRSQMTEPWHFRFYDEKTGDFKRVYPKLLLKKRITSRAPWARLVNPDSDNLIQINRIVDIGNEFSVYSRFYLSGDRFEGILKKPNKELSSLNFKTILHQEYNVSFTKASHMLQVTELPTDICQALNVRHSTVGMLVEILAGSKLKNPTYFQEVFIPPNNLRLCISDSSDIPNSWK
jgi:GntR family transcriptional regulator